MKKHLLTSLMLAGGAYLAGGQTFPTEWGARMQTVIDSVNTAQGNAIGVTAAVYMPGYGLWKGATGISSPGVPMTTDLRVLIGSNTKLFLAVAMLKLQEQGLLSLDDRIGRWIHYGPETVDTTATLRQLLSHESGMGDWYNDHPAEAFEYTIADTSAIISLQTSVDSAGAPWFQKGRGFHYSNSAYSLCGMVIKEATGKDFWQVMREEVLDPLGMDSTFMCVYEPYQPIAGTNYEGTLYTGYGYTSFITQDAPAGSLASTPQEMVQWFQKLFGGEVLNPESMKELMDFDPATLYSLGLWEAISPRLGAVYYHSGSNGAFVSEVMYDKDTKASIFIATNTIIGEDYNTGQYLAPLLDVFTKEMPNAGADAGIDSIISPMGTTCNAFIHPEIVLKNFGETNLVKASVSYSIDGSFAGGTTWTGTLTPGATTNVTLPAGLLTHGQNRIGITVSQPVPPNGGAGQAWNNRASYYIAANLETAYHGTFSEDFESAETPVLFWNTDIGMEEHAGVTKLAGYSSGHSIARPCAINYKYGSVSTVDLPLINIAAGSASILSFKYAYKTWPGIAGDSLEVVVSQDCGNTWTSLFHKGGDDLSHGESIEQMYFPETDGEWHSENISLAAYSGDILIRLRQRSGKGNNIYIDDIKVESPTSINEIAKNASIILYPNPAQNNTTISGLPAGTNIQLINITGQVLIEINTKSAAEVIELNSLTPGIYLVKTPYGTKKLMKI